MTRHHYEMLHVLSFVGKMIDGLIHVMTVPSIPNLDRSMMSWSAQAALSVRTSRESLIRLSSAADQTIGVGQHLG